MATLNSFTFFKNCNTGQNWKGERYAFKDFILDCAQEWQSQRRGYENDSKDNESLTSTPQQHKQPSVMDPAVYWKIQNSWSGSLPPSEKKKGTMVRKCVVCSAHKLWKESGVVCLRCGVAWHFAAVQVSVYTTWRKIIKQVHKNLMLFQTEILTFPFKNCYQE